MSNLFDSIPQERQSTMLANHMPTGALWKNVYNPDSNLGKLIKGLAIEFYRLQVSIEETANELDMNNADKLLPEHEKGLGIPEDCLLNSFSKTRRRQQIVQKFSKFGGVQIASDFVKVANAFGITITVSAGALVHEIDVTVIVGGGIGSFPLPFPILFNTGDVSFLKCLFNELAPANVKVNVS